MKPTQTKPPLRHNEEIKVMQGFGHGLSDKERDGIRKSLEQQKGKFMAINRVKGRQPDRDASR